MSVTCTQKLKVTTRSKVKGEAAATLDLSQQTFRLARQDDDFSHTDRQF